MLTIDTSRAFGARVAHHLQHDAVAWLTTVGPDGTPQPSPVWFHWLGDSILVYSRADTARLRNIAANSRVSFHFNGDANGGDIVVITGTATVDETQPPANQVPAYLEKYHAGLLNISMSADAFAQAYSVPLRITPEKLRGH